MKCFSQRRIVNPGFELDTNKLSITSPTLHQLRYRLSRSVNAILLEGYTWARELILPNRVHFITDEINKGNKTLKSADEKFNP